MCVPTGVRVGLVWVAIGEREPSAHCGEPPRGAHEKIIGMACASPLFVRRSVYFCVPTFDSTPTPLMFTPFLVPFSCTILFVFSLDSLFHRSSDSCTVCPFT